MASLGWQLAVLSMAKIIQLIDMCKPFAKKLFAAEVYSQGELLPQGAHVGSDVKVERSAEVHISVADDVGA